MIELISMDEVFAMAVQIEGNAARFYRKAIELSKDCASCKAFAKLAAMEDEHKKQFEAMRLATPTQPGGWAELQPEGEMYLEAIASGYRLEGSPSIAESLTGKESVTDMLRIATDLEKQAILFYLGLKKVLSDPPTRQALDRIIEEEQDHLVTLMAELKRQA